LVNNGVRHGGPLYQLYISCSNLADHTQNQIRISGTTLQFGVGNCHSMTNPFTIIIQAETIEVSGLPLPPRQLRMKVFGRVVSEMLAGGIQRFGLDGTMTAQITPPPSRRSAWAENEAGVQALACTADSGAYAPALLSTC